MQNPLVQKFLQLISFMMKVLKRDFLKINHASSLIKHDMLLVAINSSNHANPQKGATHVLNEIYMVWKKV